MHHYVTIVLIVFCAVFTQNSALASPPSTAQRDDFRKAWRAAAQSDWSTVSALEQRLGSYPLTPYLRAEQLRQNPQLITTEEMADYLHRHSDWSFVYVLKREWLRSLGEQQQYANLLRHGVSSNDDEVRCHRLQARLSLGRVDGLEKRIENVWLSGKNLPSACDAPFKWWIKQGGLDEVLAWRRAEMALAQGNHSLARYLKRHVSADRKVWLQQWINMSQRPRQTLLSSRQWPDSPLTRRIVSWGMRRLAHEDVDKAVAIWPSIQSHYTLSEKQTDGVEREMALFRAVRLQDDALTRIDQLKPAARDDQIYMWRARVALARQDWLQVMISIENLSPGARADERWRYWYARGMEALQDSGAQNAYKSLANEANFYGFLAADRINQPYAICPETREPENALVKTVAAMPLIQRAIELYRVDLDYHARATWRQATAGAATAAAVAAAAVARDAGWVDQAIHTLASVRATRHYNWRFPRVYLDAVKREARQHHIDPALLYGIMRAESALRADAVSSAGAHGLMQLLPTTAKQVAARHGLSYRGQLSLHQPENNIRLGSAYMSELLQRFTHSPMLAAGAYNAGPNIVDRWLNERPATPADAWFETIPYHETRDYIPNVLAYTTIYQWLMEGQVTPLSQRLSLVAHTLPSSAQTRKTVVCPSRNDHITALSLSNL